MRTPQILLFTDRHLILYQAATAEQDVRAWQFGNSSAGHASLCAFLEQQPGCPVLLLADLVDEEFRLQPVPPLRGRERRVWLQRRQVRLYGEDAHVHQRFVPAGAGAGADADKDAVLFSSAGNETLLQSCLHTLEQAGAVLLGFTSVALSTPHVLGSTVAGYPQLLVMSVHGSGLRETLIQSGEVRLSRLAPAAVQDIDSGMICQELEKMGRYLHSQRLLDTGAELPVWVVAGGVLAQQVEQDWGQGGFPGLCFASAEAVSSTQRIAQGKLNPLADSLYLDYLLRHSLNHYATVSDRRPYRCQRRRVLRHGALLCGLLLASVLCGHQLVGLHMLEQRQQAIASRIQHYRHLHQVAREGMPGLALSPQALRDTVLMLQRLREQQQGLARGLHCLAGILNAFPAVRVRQLHWQGGMVHPALTLHASVDGVAGDYRKAFAVVQHLIRRMDQARCVVTTTMVVAPYATQSERSLSGNAAERRRDAAFQLRMDFARS